MRYAEQWWPDFVIGGAAKSGTTSLAHYLAMQEAICLPVEDLNYFSFSEHAPNYSKAHKKPIASWEHYQSYFALCSPQLLIGERSTSYLYHKWCRKVTAQILRLHPASHHLKFIFILRQPVERMYSQYLYNCLFQEDLPFEEAITAWENRRVQGWVPAYDYCGGSLYSSAIEHYLQSFPEVKIYFFEDLCENPTAITESIMQFLKPGCASSFVIPDEKKHNQGSAPVQPWIRKLYQLPPLHRALKSVIGLLPKSLNQQVVHKLKSSLFSKPTLSQDLKKKLSGYFVEDIENLELLTAKDLSHWKY